MACEWCPKDADDCNMCREDDEPERKEYYDPSRKQYNAWAGGCIVVFVGVIGFVAGLCWIINQITERATQ